MADEWLVKNFNNPLLKKDTLYNNIKNQIEKEKTNREDIEKTIEQLSFYLDWKKKHENQYNLDDIKWGSLVDLIKNRIEDTKDWRTSLRLEIKGSIDQAYIDSIVDEVLKLAKRYNKLDKDMNWLPSERFVANVVTEMEKLFDWYELKKKTIKDLKSVVRNWYKNVFDK